MRPAQTAVLLFPMFAICVASAQDTPMAPTSDLSPRVVAARCAYTPANEACLAANNTGKETVAAQMPRRMPGPPMRPYPRMGYPRPVYPRWEPQVSARHAIIGAVIGFGVGAAIGGRSGAKDALSVGGVSAGLGALFGLLTPPMPGRYDRWRYDTWPDDDDDQATSRSPKSRQSRKAKRHVAHSSEVEVAQTFPTDQRSRKHDF